MKKVMTIKAEVKVERPNGAVETLDITGKFARYDAALLAAMKKNTADAGRGKVLEFVVTELWNNLADVTRQYNNLHNEGGEGYIPELKATESEERVVIIK